MNEHERAAMETALYKAQIDARTESAFIKGWEAHAKYEPPVACGAKSSLGAWICDKDAHHDGDHRACYGSGGYYFGWPRT